MLFHRDIYYPNELDTYCNHIVKKDFEYSKHLMDEIFDSRSKSKCINYNYLWKILKNLQQYEIRPFEVETDNETGLVKKFAVRVNYDRYRDICIVIGYGEETNTIITAWLNNKYDKHSTLDESAYYQGE